jgi:hypothetical protein
MQRVTVEDIPSRAYRGLELLLIAPAVLLSLMGIGLLVGLDGDLSPVGTGAISLLLLGMFIFVPVALLLTPPLVYLDAKKVADRDLEWEPNPLLYAVLAVPLNGLVVIEYLYKRHGHVVDWVGSEKWWYCTLFGAVALTIGAVGVAVSGLAVLPIAYLGIPFFAVGIYRDTTYVRLNSDWHPNPANHFVAALFAGALLYVWVPYFAYYLFKRARSVGLY